MPLNFFGHTEYFLRLFRKLRKTTVYFVKGKEKQATTGRKMTIKILTICTSSIYS